MINFYVYDQNFELKAVLDEYSSLIWSDRFNECGDFELSLPYQIGHDIFGSFLIQNNYVGVDYTNRKMIIEKIEYRNDDESVPEMIVSGRSLESILDRRIVPNKKEFGSDSSQVNLQNSIQTLLNENIISASTTNRRIPNFTFQASTDTAITVLTFSESYHGDDLYSIISDLCQDKKIGFKIVNTSGANFVFSLYAGVDRSKNQTLNSFVIFSPYYDNLKNTNFYSSMEEYKNIMFIGKGEEDNQYVTAYNDSDPSGLQRREIYLDQDDLKENNEDELTDSQLQVKGKKKLKNEYKIKTGIEGEIVPEVLYTYGTDYNVGDKVELTDIYGNSQSVRISEVVISCDENGLTIIPTFEEIEPK